jgi:Rrf2 family protein
MKVSTRGRYAFTAMIALAINYGNGPLTLGTIAKDQDISVKYLENIMRMFSAGGLVVSSKGNKGGFILSKDPSKIAMSDILKVTEGTLTPVACLDNPGFCVKKERCYAVKAWDGLFKAMDTYLNSLTLADIIADGIKTR